MCVTSRSCSSALAMRGSTGPPASTKKASLPGPAARRYVFDSQPSLMERSRIMDGTLRADAARPLGAHVADPVRLGDVGGLPLRGLPGEAAGVGGRRLR